jgi:hypothetical protein
VVVVEHCGKRIQLLRGALKTIRGVGLVACARNVQDAVKICVELKPDCLILGLRLPDGDGSAVAHAAANENSKVRVILIPKKTERTPSQNKGMGQGILFVRSVLFGALMQWQKSLEPCLRDSKDRVKTRKNNPTLIRWPGGAKGQVKGVKSNLS